MEMLFGDVSLQRNPAYIADSIDQACDFEL
jgi:hypothetical protein